MSDGNISSMIFFNSFGMIFFEQSHQKDVQFGTKENNMSLVTKASIKFNFIIFAT